MTSSSTTPPRTEQCSVVQGSIAVIPDRLWEVEGGAHEEEAVEVLCEVYLLEIAGSLFVLIAFLQSVVEFAEEGFGCIVEAIDDHKSNVMLSVSISPFRLIV